MPKLKQIVEAAMNLWMLTAKDRNLPPFPFRDVPHTLFVAAETAEAARHTAAVRHGEHWRDEAMASCDEFVPTKRGVVAHVMTA